ncbi:hypothetical protein ACQR1I_13335 [Bradyrhizobium sp. HKCCYLS2038]|uniref:hypothetical protein n=1 Tax=unclassified Bradyrhizobium TaxID=2631580 RepID=UPI003EBFB93A
MPTRSNLRDGFAMVDEVFALSPISARAAQPNEADYEAIRDAFMETSRGRWFLGEYAKRNRNADTSMVLDAVARIEHALASQRQQHQEFERADSKALPEALASIRAAVEDAALATAAAVDGLALEQNLAPVRKGTRIIKEISWRWREIGADSRICDLIDSQVTSIEAACEQLASTDPKVALLAAFEIIKTRLNELDRNEAATPPAGPEPVPTGRAAQAAEASPSPDDAGAATMQPEAAQKVEAAVSELVAAVAAIELADEQPVRQATAVKPTVEPPPAAALADPPVATVAPESAAASAAEAEIVPPETSVGAEANEDAAAAEAQDEAILELVAAEMGAPETFEDEEFGRTRTLGFDIEEPSAVDDDIVASFSASAPLTAELAPAAVEAPVANTNVQPAASAAAPAPATPLPPRVELATMEFSVAVEAAARIAAAADTPASPPLQHTAIEREPLAPIASTTAQQAMPKPAYEPSLGSTLLSNGLLQRPQTPANDPLTPIRRMSQPEKIAFFS